MIAKVLTANRLLDGVVVWLGADGNWQKSLKGALVARHAQAVEALEAAGRLAANLDEVVDVNLIEVEDNDEGLVPLRLRERIRLNGPTIATFAAKNFSHLF